MAERPRVLIVGPLPPPYGGVQLMIGVQLHSSLAETYSLGTVDISKRKLRWSVESPTWRTPFYFLRDLGRLVRALIRVRPDVVLVHAAGSFSFLRDWALMLSARAAGAKVVCHYHGTLHTRFPSCETPRGRTIGRFLMRMPHAIVVLGPTYQRLMGQAWNRRVEWSPNTCDVELYRSVPPDAPAPWLAPGERGVLFVGRLSAPKGIYDLLDAIPKVVARHPDARFVLAGVAESEALEPVLRAEVEKRGIADSTTFLGHVEGRDKVTAYVTSHMLVVPSWTEAFPLVIPEGMASGLPVISSAVGAIPDFVSDGEDGFLIPPRDPAALADRISRLLDDEALRRRMSERVRDRAAREFGIEAHAVRMRNVIRGVLDGRFPG